MVFVLKRDWKMYDATKIQDEQEVVVKAGNHEVELIDNPFGFKNAPWIVLKGTKIGRTEASLRDWKSVAAADRSTSRSKKRFDLQSYKVVFKE